MQLEHASGTKLYLRVPTGSTYWQISDTIDGTSFTPRIVSGSAGGLCPAQPSAAVNSRYAVTRWRYREDNGKLVQGGVKIRCENHK